MKQIQIVLILLIAHLHLSAQNQNPPDIFWKSLKSSHFEVIFPDNIEKDAQRIANTLEWVYQHDTKSLKISPKPISMLLYSQSTNSNAYAALGPRRMGWYMTPPQTLTSLGSTEWIQTLSLHEYRHVVQYAKNKQHFTKFMTYLFGDVGQSMMRWSIPDWFFEGDAILMETAYTESGRGRLPSFSMSIRTYALTNEKFTYDQAYLGSYKRYYPDHYYLGYQLAAYGRVNYGSDIWDNVLERTSKISFWPYAFGNSLKKYTGLNNNRFYKKAMVDLNDKWQTQATEIKATEAKIINTKKKKNWTNYFNPQYDKSGNIISGKESLDKISAFYKITPNGKEKKLKNTDAGIFNINDDKIAWSRTIPDIRWGEKDYTEIVIYDLKTKSELTVSKKAKYLSPSLSPNGKQLAAVSFSPAQQCELNILDATTSELIKSYAIGANDYIRTPVWSADGKQIAFTHAKFEGSSLSLIDLSSGQVKNIVAANWENTGRPVFYKNYIIYNSDYSGIGNIYATDLDNGQRYQITSRPYGAYNAAISPDGKKMLFQDYSKKGFDIAEMDLNPENWKKLENVQKTDAHYYNQIVEQEGNITINESNQNDSVYRVEKYKKSRDLINIHSWGIYPHATDLEVSATSNNYLNTFGIDAGYLYNINENTNAGFLGFSYARFFPIFGLTSLYGQRAETVETTNNGLITDKWEEFRSNVSLSLPFNLSRNVYNTSLSLKGGLGYTYTKERDVSSVTRKPNGDFTTYFGSISFNRTQHLAHRDFVPRWAQIFTSSFNQVTPQSPKEGYIFSTQAGLYFPGIFAQHSIKLGGAFEKQPTYNANNRSNSYYFSSMVSYPRGYELSTYDKLYKFSADYQLPIWYPDISAGPLAYFKRIRAGIFYDYADTYLSNKSSVYQSVGGSLLVEFYLFKIKYPFEMGVQMSHRLTDGQNEYSILIFGLPL